MKAHVTKGEHEYEVWTEEGDLIGRGGFREWAVNRAKRYWNERHRVGRTGKVKLEIVDEPTSR